MAALERNSYQASIKVSRYITFPFFFSFRYWARPICSELLHFNITWVLSLSPSFSSLLLLLFVNMGFLDVGTWQEESIEGIEELGYDLRSRGLCLVPVECSLHVASSNGADLWAPAVPRNSRNSSIVWIASLFLFLRISFPPEWGKSTRWSCNIKGNEKKSGNLTKTSLPLAASLMSRIRWVSNGQLFRNIKRKEHRRKWSRKE